MIRVIVSVFLQMDHADTEEAVMMEEYSEFHSESLNEDVLLSLREGGPQLRLFVGRCHRAERVPRSWQRPAALILLPTHRRWWRGFS